jgi:hypothetical protein
MRLVNIIWGFFLHRLRVARHPTPELLKAGVKAPDFDLPDESGNRHRLQDYAGKKVILWFFLRSRTPG